MLICRSSDGVTQMLPPADVCESTCSVTGVYLESEPIGISNLNPLDGKYLRIPRSVNDKLVIIILLVPNGTELPLVIVAELVKSIRLPAIEKTPLVNTSRLVTVIGYV